MRKLMMLACLLALLLLPLLSFAEEPEAEPVTAEQFLSSFDYQKGLVELPNGVAQLDVPEAFRYIGTEDAKRFLEEGWGNPEGSGTLGMLLPVDTDLFGPEGWAVVITYQEDGYVSDEDAADIDYDEMLVSMQEDTEQANEKRQELGYETLSLVGWARPPHYDSAAKKLFWAKELQFAGNEESTLNYNVRILGRKGVLVMNAVSAMSQLPEVEARMDQVLAFSDFKDGYRYSDYDSGIDKVAGYGLAALIGGKVAAKAGLLAKLGGLLVAFKKLIFVGIAAVGGFFAKFFKRNKTAAEPPTPAE
jgi:uncharacterized membrane-anchored protein